MREEIARYKNTLSETIKHKALTAEQKVLCEQWKASGLKREQFCKKHAIPTSTFYGWCKKLWPTDKINKSTFLPIVPLAKETRQYNIEESTLELNLPGQIVVKVTLPLKDIVAFIQELSHAATTIR